MLIQEEADLAENLHELEVSEAVSEQLEDIKVLLYADNSGSCYDNALLVDNPCQRRRTRGGICPD